MAGLALVTPRTAAQGGHGLAVKTMFRFNPSSLNKDECWILYHHNLHCYVYSALDFQKALVFYKPRMD